MITAFAMIVQETCFHYLDTNAEINSFQLELLLASSILNVSKAVTFGTLIDILHILYKSLQFILAYYYYYFLEIHFRN